MFGTIWVVGGLTNKLYYGDNLDILPTLADESVDLVYLDPPFNSNRSYNVIFARHPGDHDADASAQIQAFDDTWHWTPVTDQQYQRYVFAGELPTRVAEALTAFWTLLGENDAMAYLVNMAARLVQLHRVLKATGSLYLHCDPTMSHYLKVMLDAVFGPQQSRNEIIWRRYGSHNDAKGYGSVHDVIFYYVKGRGFTFNRQFTAYTDGYIAQRFRSADADGRRWREQNLVSPNPRPNLTYRYTALNGVTYDPPPNGWKVTPERMVELDVQRRLLYPTKPDGRLRLKNYLDEGKGVPVPDIWTDIPALGGKNPERLGYQTQKPTALLERILTASSNPGDVVLDSFCGCGTTIDAAQRLGRQWIGIDITFIAIDLIEKRLQDRYPGIAGTYETFGIPRDMAGARALFARSPFDFERWAVSRINAQPNEKQVGDKGSDGVARFYLDKKTTGRVLVSVKGGRSIGPHFVRDLVGTVETQKAQMGVLITMAEPPRGVIEAAHHGGSYTWPTNGQSYPRVQVITVAELLSGKRPDMPPPILPYIQAARAAAPIEQMTFGGIATAL